MPITLVPESMALPGRGFLFRGPNAGPECQGCPYQKLCFGLAPGHAYKVTGGRGVTHPCALHDGDRVHVVDVEETTFVSTVEARLLRGTAATWTPIACGKPECGNWKLCHPVGPLPGHRHAITKTHDEVSCPAGFDLVKVDLQPME